MRSPLYFFLPLLLSVTVGCCSGIVAGSSSAGGLKVGAEKYDDYLQSLSDQRVAVVANQTSMVDSPAVHLVDRLLQKGIDIGVVFAPEHGFRGEAGAGEKVKDGRDPGTGIRIVSLYGKKYKPAPEDLEGIDVILFDIQDVGVRFYTYISTLHYVMEAAGDAGIPVVVLDRPNPNGGRVDGPVLDTSLKSFVGISPIPILHGLTIGEFARMSLGEGWIDSKRPCSLSVVKMDNYTHSLKYRLPVNPSPNLRTENAIYLYPSLCLFEGTAVSIGRGTDFPFEVYGFPGYGDGGFRFTPRDQPGIAPHPPFENVECSGKDLRKSLVSAPSGGLDISYLMDAYQKYPDKERFFNSFFEKLSGNETLRKQIQSGLSPDSIAASWKEELDVYKRIRAKYLLYPE